MQLKYGLDSRPPFWQLLLFGLQWLAVVIPGIAIIGNVVSRVQFADYPLQVMYLQKITFVTSLTLLVQVLWGHRLPLVAGPSTVLLVGVIGSQGVGAPAIYSSILTGGALLGLLGLTGLFSHVQRLFTARVIAVVLLLIAFTLMPTIVVLLTAGAGKATLPNLLFASVYVSCMFMAYRFGPAMLRSTLIVWAMILASVAYLALFPDAMTTGGTPHGRLVAGFFSHLTGTPVFEPGVLVAFLLCFVALSINDLGSIQSLDSLLKPTNMPRRVKGGIVVTGMMNVVSGFLGIIGPVNFSLSPGVIASSGCASRYTLLPTALLLLVLSASPLAMGIISNVPSVIIAGLLVYVLTFQVAAGLTVAFKNQTTFQFDDGIIIGLPLLVGTLVSLLPVDVLRSLPPVLRPVLGNGFVLGVLTALILEHLVFSERQRASHDSRTAGED